MLTRKHSPNSARRRIFDGAAEAKLIALACSKPPKGRARWTLRLLEEAVVELNIVDRASDNTIGRTLKKTLLKPHLKQQWVIPPDANAAFVAAMEDVLEVYHRPHDPDVPRGLPGRDLEATHRRNARADPGEARATRRGTITSTERNGTANLFMMFAPLEGWRHVKVTDRHTAVDYAQVLKELSDTHFPNGREDRARAGQSQHPQAGFTLRSLPRRRGPPARRAVRVALHAQARQLAGHG